MCGLKRIRSMYANGILITLVLGCPLLAKEFGLENEEIELTAEVQRLYRDLERLSTLPNGEIFSTSVGLAYKKTSEYLELIQFIPAPDSEIQFSRKDHRDSPEYLNYGRPLTQGSDTRRRSLRLTFTSGKLTQIVSIIEQEEDLLKQLTIADNAPFASKLTGIELASTTYNTTKKDKAREYKVRLGEIENIITIPARNQFYRNAYIPHLKELIRMGQLFQPTKTEPSLSANLSLAEVSQRSADELAAFTDKKVRLYEKETYGHRLEQFLPLSKFPARFLPAATRVERGNNFVEIFLYPPRTPLSKKNLIQDSHYTNSTRLIFQSQNLTAVESRIFFRDMSGRTAYLLFFNDKSPLKPDTSTVVAYFASGDANVLSSALASGEAAIANLPGVRRDSLKNLSKDMPALTTQYADRLKVFSERSELTWELLRRAPLSVDMRLIQMLTDSARW